MVPQDETLILSRAGIRVREWRTHVDIRHGLMRHGPLDVDDSASPTHLRVGLVGTEETIIDLRQWLPETCAFS